MKVLKNILYLLYVLFVAASILLIFFDDTILDAFNVANDPSFWKAWLTGALFLFIFDILVENAHLANYQRRTRRLEQELNRVKARYYDDLADKKEKAQKEGFRIFPKRREDPPPAEDYPYREEPPARPLPPAPDPSAEEPK